MSEPLRPDPDELLASIKKDESKLHSARLRMFSAWPPVWGKHMLC